MKLRLPIGKLLRHPFFFCLLSFSICFVLALYLYLPLDPLTRKAEQMAAKQGIELQIFTPRLSFPPGLSAKRLLISQPQLPHPPFELSALKVQPLWSSLFSNNQGAAFSFKLMQGLVSGSAFRNGQVTAEAKAVQLHESLEPQLPLKISATLETASFDGQLPFGGKNHSNLELNLRELVVDGMEKLGSGSPQLVLGELKCKADAQGTIIRLTQLSLSGPAIDLKGTGTMRLGRTPANSSLNLSLVLTPKEGLDPMLGDLLKLTRKPLADGSYRLNLNGTLTNLRLK